MIKLLNAGFARVRKNYLFWLLLAFSIGLALFMCFAMYSDMKEYGDKVDIGQLMLNYSTIIGIVIAIFTSLFLGAEYSDGTIRNKIGAGHKRAHIYFANFLVSTVISLFSYAVFIAAVACVGIPLFGPTKMPVTGLLQLLGCIVLAVIAYSGIFTFIAMILSNKAVAAIVSITLAFGLIMLALACIQVVGAQEFVPSFTMVDGELVQEVIKNPHYPSEEKRKLYQFLCDINPAGQMYQLAGREEPDLITLPFYAMGNIILFTVTGIVLFYKKDLK